MLMGDSSRSKRVGIIVEISLLLHVPTSSHGQCIKLSIEVGLRLDERSTIITHWLVTSVGVLGKDGIDRGDENHDEKNQTKDGVEKNEQQATNAAYKTLKKN